MGDRHQHLIASGMPIGVVDGLEAIEVGEQHGDRRRVALEPAQGPREAVQQQYPVRQPGQRVEQRPAGQLDLGGLLFADILDVHDEVATAVRAGRHARAGQRDRHRVAVGVQQLAAGDVPTATRRDHLLPAGQCRGGVGGCEVFEAAADQGRRRIAEQVAQRIVDL